MTDDRRAAIELELRHGQAALSAARALRDLGLLNDALSRLYYAAFHHAVALLLSVGVEPRRHRALPGLLATHFVDDIAPTDVQAIARLATDRDLADYERAWEADRATLDRAFADAEPLIERFRALLEAGGWLPAPPAA